MIKAVVFDLDHTLFDRYETIRLVVPKFRTRFEINEGITDEFIFEELSWADKHYVHKGWQNIYKHLCEKNIFKCVPTYDEYAKFLVGEFKKVAVPYPFAIPTVEKIREMGFKTGIITNGMHEIQNNKLNMLGLKPYFDVIFIGGDFPYEKPDQRIFKLMAKELNIDTSEMMFVGDHPKFDVDGSRNAGCESVWVKTTGTWIFPEIEKPSIQVDNVSYLPEILEGLKKR